MSTHLQPSISNDKWLAYLFSQIMPQIDFGVRGASHLPDLKALLGTSSALLDASVALSAMYHTRRPGSDPQHDVESRIAFSHYSSSLRHVREALASPCEQDHLPILWTIFLLSFFELMADASGDNWIRHILTGISRMLEACGTSRLRTGGYRRFFLEIRIFEISRSLITTTESILVRPEWRLLSKEVWLGKYRHEWHPNDLLLDLMVEISDLGWR